MTDMTMDELLVVLQMQEEVLQFSHFTNEDAWEVGNAIVAEGKRRGLSASVKIRLNNGLTVFQYAADDLNLDGESWMDRKMNLVRRLERSSLAVYMMLKKDEESLSDLCLDSREYAAAGGAFPIRVEEVGVIGSIAVSGLDQVSEHDLIIRALGRYLHVDEVPRIQKL
jgi:uncharacterized protein (UPF0303 family)